MKGAIPVCLQCDKRYEELPRSTKSCPNGHDLVLCGPPTSAFVGGLLITILPLLAWSLCIAALRPSHVLLATIIAFVVVIGLTVFAIVWMVKGVNLLKGGALAHDVGRARIATAAGILVGVGGLLFFGYIFR